ncbi:MAG: HrpJ domain-containing protein [Pseudomonadota bacterium]
MPQHIEGLGSTLLYGQHDAHNESQQIGSFKGEHVTSLPSNSILDAAEEMTFSASESAESEEKKLSDRGVHDSGNAQLLAQVQKILDQMGDFNKEDLVNIIKKLKGLQSFTLNTLNDAIKNTFKDPSHQHGALIMIQDAFKDDAKALETITQCISDIESEHGAAIYAGYNIAHVDTDFIESSEGKRVLYRDTILHYDSYEKTLLSLVEKYGPDELPRAIAFLGSALSADMLATKSSLDMEQLKEINDGITIMQNLLSFHNATCTLLDQIDKLHGDSSLHPKEIMQAVFALKDLPLVTKDTIQVKMPFLVSPQAIRDAALAQGCMALVQNMPHKLFASLDIRTQIIDSFRNLMEDLTAKEEALYE